MHSVLTLTQVLFSLLLVFCVLLQSGKDDGPSGMMGASASGGGALLGRNIKRYTIILGALWALNIIALVGIR